MLDARVERPAYARDRLRIGQLHLGVGAFMRAHTAVYTDAAIAASGGDWGIAGVSLRHATVRDQLAAQDCLYTVATLDGERRNYRLVAALRSIDVAPEDPAAIVARIADPAIRVITLTVTEKGYGLDPDSGRLDAGNELIRADLDHLLTPRSTLGFIVAGVARRMSACAGPITLVSCDNLPGNGARLKSAIYEFAGITRPDLTSWMDDHVRFPGTMVDRIVPATTEADIIEAARELGCRDEALVKAEPFTQWVIEDDFAGGRPDWEAGGALFVDAVEPYETAKLRMLNGTHSALAYLGYLGGFTYIHEAIGNPDYRRFASYLMQSEIAPVTPEPGGMAHETYIERLLQRFSNAALRHRSWQIAMDGSQKLPQRLLNTVRAQLHRGGPVAGLALAVAAWMRYGLGHDESGQSIDVQDPLAERFRDIGQRCGGDAEALVDAYLAIDSVFGQDLAADSRFASIVAGQLRLLMARGARATVQEFTASLTPP